MVCILLRLVRHLPDYREAIVHDGVDVVHPERLRTGVLIELAVHHCNTQTPRCQTTYIVELRKQPKRHMSD